MTEKTRLIYRAQRNDENPYFQFRRATAQDRALTFEARGMLAYILSKPDHWKVQPSDLEQQCKKSVVYRVLGELIKHGYIDRQQERDDKKKIIAWHYIVHEEPLPKKQEVALPEVENQDLGNQDIRDKRKEEKKEKKKKENNSDAVSIYIKAWLDGQKVQPATNQYGNTTNRKIAKEIADAGYSTEQVTQYTQALSQTPYWGGKLVSFKYVGDNIAAAFKGTIQTPPPVPPPPSPPEERPLLTGEQLAVRQAEYERLMKQMTDTIVSPVVKAVA